MTSEPAPVLRVTTFRPRDPWQALDHHLRTELMPRLADQAGLLAAWAGRRGPDVVGERVVISVWASPAAEAAGLTVPELLAALPEDDVRLADCDTEVLPVVIHEEFPRDEPMRILRVFRGVVVEGALERYLERARRGTQQDGARPDGPGAVVMGIARPDGFVTATTWWDWPAIATATGGDIGQPLATRHRDLLREGSPVHYELLAARSGRT